MHQLAKALFLTGILFWVGVLVNVAGPSLVYAGSDPVSTYYEYATTIINGTASNSTDNLDTEDGIYYAVDCDTSPIAQSQTLTYYSTVDAGTWVDIPNIDTNDTGYASTTSRTDNYWVEIDDHTISGDITSVIVKIDCWTDVTTADPEFVLGFSTNGTTVDVATTTIDCTTSEATYTWAITGYIANWTQIDNLRLHVKSNDPGKPQIGVWYVDFHRVEVEATVTVSEVDIHHFSQPVTESLAYVTQIFFEDNFKFNATVTAYLEWFNWTANAWANLNSGLIGSTEVTWSKTWTSGFGDVINSTGYMKVNIYTSNESNEHRLLEDYLHWDVTYVVPDTTPPAWSNAGTNNTVAGEPTLFYVKWTDNAGLSSFIFGTNNTGTWLNDTWTPMSGTTDWSNVTKILNSSVGVVVQWKIWANDTSNNWNDTGIQSLTTASLVDTVPPAWSNAGTNNTLAGQPTLFYVRWTDNFGLSGFIFGTNNTGTWVNETWTPIGGTSNWSNVTKTLNSTVDIVVQWRVWANDTSNNWNDTGTLSLTTTTVGYALNLCVKDWDLVDPISGAYVYVNSDVKISDANGWANWTGLSGTVNVKVKWYGAWVNGTSVAMGSDKTIDVQCNIFDITVTCIEGVQSAVLQHVNVTVYNSTSVPSNMIRTGITGSDGKAILANVPNSTLTLTCYDGASPQHVIANVTKTITTENQAEIITCDHNYVSTTTTWSIIEIIYSSSLYLGLILLPEFCLRCIRCLKERIKTIRSKQNKRRGGKKKHESSNT